MNNNSNEKLSAAMSAVVNHCALLSRTETARYLVKLSEKIRDARAALFESSTPCNCCGSRRTDHRPASSPSGHPMEPYGDPRWEYDPTPYPARNLE